MEENYTSNEVVGFIGKLSWKPIFFKQGAMTIVRLDTYVVKEQDKFVKVTIHADKKGFIEYISKWLSQGEDKTTNVYGPITIGVFHFGRYIKDEQMPEKSFATRNSEVFIPYGVKIEGDEGKYNIGKNESEIYIHEELFSELFSEFKCRGSQ